MGSFGLEAAASRKAGGIVLAAGGDRSCCMTCSSVAWAAWRRRTGARCGGRPNGSSAPDLKGLFLRALLVSAPSWIRSGRLVWPEVVLSTGGYPCPTVAATLSTTLLATFSFFKAALRYIHPSLTCPSRVKTQKLRLGRRQHSGVASSLEAPP
jgi:hypothetical protein